MDLNKEDLFDLSELTSFLINKWQSGELYKYYYNDGFRGEILYKFVLWNVGDHMDEIIYKIEKKVEKEFEETGVYLDYLYLPHDDIRSLRFEVLDFLSFASVDPVEEIMAEDIPFILDILDTPPDKSLEGWDRWEKYWASLDFPARRRKLLGE